MMGLVRLAAEEILIDRNKHVGHKASAALCQIHPYIFTLTLIYHRLVMLRAFYWFFMKFSKADSVFWQTMCLMFKMNLKMNLEI